MRNLLFLFLLTMTLSSLQAQSTTAVDAQVKAVTVYLNRAQLTNTVRASVQSGANEIAIGNISPSIDAQSIQVASTGGSGVVMAAVRFEENYLREDEKPRALTELETSLEAARDRLEQLNNEQEVLQQEESLVLANKGLGSENTAVTAARLAEMADFFRTRLTEIKRRLQRVKKEIKDAEKEVEQLTRQTQQYRASNRSGRILVTLRSDQARTVELNLTYVAYQAGWSPSYDLRVLEVGQPVQLTYRAQVTQSTGVNWEGVRLTLSTANPSAGGNKPELMPQYVRIFEPQPRPQMAKRMSMRAPAPAKEEIDADMMLESQAAGSAADYTAVQENTLATEFAIDLPYTIPSGGRPELVDIQRYDLPAEYLYATAPKLDPAAFLLASITGWGEYNLLSGPANVFFEGAYVAETFLNVNATTDTLDVSLGRDARIVVKRERIKEFKEKNWLGTKRGEQFGYELTLRNTKSVAATIRVEDQMPISTNESIKVTRGDLGGAEYEEKTGKLTWTLTVPPGETRTLQFRYTVEYPKGQQITGL
ncbi:DUF4139 domain-containing protein [Catalinimonas alkaloidigena]|nr:DUF4139 domain-containing protein [Catalinimonas alkaloidigena]